MAIEFPDDVLFLDCETHSVTERFDKDPDDYFQLGQLAWGEGEVWTTKSRQKTIDEIRKARIVVAQNGHQFDWSVIFGKASMEPVTMARDQRLLDTMVHATIATPAPFRSYENYKGVLTQSSGPDQYRRFYGLANLSHQLSVGGKLFDLAPLADRYLYTMEPTYSEKTGKRLKNDRKVKIEGLCCSFGAPGLSKDPDFISYAAQDVVALRNVARALLEIHGFSDYAAFEQMKAAIAAQITRNGFRVDQELARAKEYSQMEEAAHTLNWLRDTYEFPVNRKKPLATIPGKEALTEALISTGVKIGDLALTGNKAPSFGAESVLGAAKKAGTPEALALAEAVGTLAGQRSIPQLALASVHADGLVHPSIAALQRSRRFSTTEPGLTVTSPDHKDLYIADSDDDLLVCFDFSNADARAVAAMSGDPEFAKRFAPGADGHMINAHLLWGADVVGTDKKDPVTAKFRQDAKAPGHGIGYGMGASKMAETTGVSLKDCKTFVKNYQAAYKGVVAWQKRTVEFARRNGYVVTDWGTRLVVEKGREATMATGLLGQNATHELLLEGCIRLPDRLLRRVKLTVHDEVILSLAKETLDRDIALVIKCFTTTWHPKGGQSIDFPLSHGTPGRTWKDADH